MMLSSDNLEKMSGLLTSDLPIIGPLSPGNQLCSLCMCLQGRVPTKIVLASDLNACSPSPPLAVRSHNRGTRGASRVSCLLDARRHREGVMQVLCFFVPCVNHYLSLAACLR